MTETTTLTSREAVPVTIGLITLYCENFKASAARRLTEESTVAGEGVITNDSNRAMEMTFSGRVYDEQEPLRYLLYAYNMLRSGMTASLNYRGLSFSACHMKAFNIEDIGEEYYNISITVMTQNSVAWEGNN